MCTQKKSRNQWVVSLYCSQCLPDHTEMGHKPYHWLIYSYLIRCIWTWNILKPSVNGVWHSVRSPTDIYCALWTFSQCVSGEGAREAASVRLFKNVSFLHPFALKVYMEAFILSAEKVFCMALTCGNYDVGEHAWLLYTLPMLQRRTI